jgi:5-methylcytosine-specific restriction endonuclease McrA
LDGYAGATSRSGNEDSEWTANTRSEWHLPRMVKTLKNRINARRYERMLEINAQRYEQMLEARASEMTEVVDYTREQKIELTAAAFGVSIPQKKKTTIPKLFKNERDAKVIRKARKRLYAITTCAYCGRQATETRDPDGRTWHMDHVYPICLGGSDSLDNIVKSCARCNISKGAKIKTPLPNARLASSI